MPSMRRIQFVRLESLCYPAVSACQVTAGQIAIGHLPFRRSLPLSDCRWWPRAARAALVRSIRARPASQVRLDQETRAAAEADAIDLHVFHDALHVVARLRERDALDPVDRIDLGVARVAVAADPFLDPAAAGVIGGE